MASSFEKTNYYVSHCDSRSCVLAQEEEQDLWSGDPQLTDMSRLFASLHWPLCSSLVGCAGGSTMTLSLNVELQFFCVALASARDLLPLES